MIHYPVLEKIFEDIKHKQPDLTDQEAAKLALEKYNEIDFLLMMGTENSKSDDNL